jgi:large subunit ribosomal protein L33
MAKKKTQTLVRLESTGKNAKGDSTGYFYVAERNPRNTTEKLKKMKFDPRAMNAETGKAGAHVEFEEKRNKFK